MNTRMVGRVMSTLRVEVAKGAPVVRSAQQLPRWVWGGPQLSLRPCMAWCATKRRANYPTGGCCTRNRLADARSAMPWEGDREDKPETPGRRAFRAAQGRVLAAAGAAKEGCCQRSARRWRRYTHRYGDDAGGQDSDRLHRLVEGAALPGRHHDRRGIPPAAGSHRTDQHRNILRRRVARIHPMRRRPLHGHGPSSWAAPS